MTVTLKITAKGQVTLRKDVLDHLGVTTGDTVAVDLLPGGRAALRPAAGGKPVERLFGALTPDRRLSLADIRRITEAGWAGRQHDD